MVKRCSRCCVEKPLEEFTNSFRYYDGKRPWCRDCRTQSCKDWRADNPTKTATYNRLRYEQAGHLDRERNRRWWNDPQNRERRLQLKREHGALRRSRFGGFKIPWTLWKACCDSYGNACLRCGTLGTPESLTQDHVVPLSSGGQHHIDNLQPLCRACNSTKHTQRWDFRVEYHLEL